MADLNINKITVSGINYDIEDSAARELANSKSTVSVSASGTATDTVQYITVDGVEKKLAGSSGEPDAYLKNATTSGNTLTLTKKDNSTVTFTPTEVAVVGASTDEENDVGETVKIWIDTTESYAELDDPQIVQVPGQSTMKVMSQKAVTDEIAKIESSSRSIEGIVESGSYQSYTFTYDYVDRLDRLRSRYTYGYTDIEKITITQPTGIAHMRVWCICFDENRKFINNPAHVFGYTGESFDVLLSEVFNIPEGTAYCAFAFAESTGAITDLSPYIGQVKLVIHFKTAVGYEAAQNEVISRELFDNSLQVLDIEGGGLNGSSGQPTSRTDRCRTVNYIPYKEGVNKAYIYYTASISSAITVQLFWYNSDYSWESSYKNTSYAVIPVKSEANTYALELTITANTLTTGMYYKLVFNTAAANADKFTHSKYGSGYTKSVKADVDALDVKVAEIDTRTAGLTAKTSYLSEWYVGGLNSIGGKAQSVSWEYAGCLSGYYYLNTSDIVTLTDTTNYTAQIAFYTNEAGEEYDFVSSSSFTTYTSDTDNKLVRIAIVPTAGTTYTEVPAAVYSLVTITSGNADTISSNKFNRVKMPPRYYGQSIVKELTKADTIAGNTDMCMVGDELWWFKELTVDTGEQLQPIYKCNFDFENGSITLKNSSLQHNLGHVNSVNYNSHYDTLICGNGSSSYTLAGKIMIIENASTRTEPILQTSDSGTYTSNIIEITDAAVTTGAKINVIWGEDNLGGYDIAYIICDDGRKITRIQLGRGTNQFTYGTIIPGATGFNGTFNILAQHCQPSYGYGECIQGADWCNGSIYCGIGHRTSGMSIRRFTLREDDLEVQDFYTLGYNATGSKTNVGVNQCAAYQDRYILAGGGPVRAIDTWALRS